MSQSAIAEAAKNSLGVEVEQAQEAIGNSPVSIAPIRRSNSPIWNLHSHSKCATPGANQKLLELARSHLKLLAKQKTFHLLKNPVSARFSS